MRILIVMTQYRPDGGAGSLLFTMLAEELVRRGHQVTVLTAVPHYPSGRVPRERRGKLRTRTYENGVEVVRVALPSLNRYNLFCRAIQFLVFQLGATLAGWNHQYDVLLTWTPALEVWLPFAFFSQIRHKPAVYSVHDVYPEVGIEMGVFRHKAVIKLVAGLENYCLRRADKVRILSESFAPGMVARGVPESRLSLIYDWVDTDFVRPLPRTNRFALEHDLVNRFVVLYAGNIGVVQGLECVLDAAKLLSDHESVRFVLVGDGTARKSLMERTNQLGLRNVQFVPYRPFSEMPEVLATADVSLVSLVEGVGSGALPSKSFSILASGRPLLASIDPDSDLVHLVRCADAGICVPPGSPRLLAEAITKLENEPRLRKRYGDNGRAYALRYHSPQEAAIRFEELLSAAIRERFTE